MLKLRPTLRRNWVALAVAYHLNGSLENAKKVLENYEATLKVSDLFQVRINRMYIFGEFRTCQITTLSIQK